MKNHYPEVVRWEGSNFSPKPGSEVNFSLISVLRGEGKVQVEGLVSDFNTGDLFFFPPKREHRAWSTSKSGNRFLCLQFSVELAGDNHFFSSFLSDIVSPGLDSAIPGASFQAQAMAPLIMQMESLSQEKDTDSYLLIKARTIELIYHLRQFYKQTGQLSDPGSGQSRKYHRLIPTLSYIQKNIHLKHSVPSLAHYANFSTSRFAHLFQEVMGQSVGDYLLEIRMEKARTLLLSTSLSMEQMAATLGLSSAKVLSRQFTKYFEKSPRSYCKEQRKD